MLTYIHLFNILISVILTQCRTGQIIQTRRKNSNIIFRNDYTYVPKSQSFYKYHTTMKNWHDAKEVCNQEGAKLFYAINKTEADAMIAFWTLKALKPPSLWHQLNLIFVGISDIINEGVFVTIDGKPITEVYNVWDKNQPDNFEDDEDCVQLNQEGKLNDVKCTTLSYFVCMKSLKSLQQSTTKSTSCKNSTNTNVTLKTFVFWPNGTVPFYINPDHFDDEQATVILKSLSMFMHNTCIKFAPVMVAPDEGQHVMTFINPEGVMRCKIETKGHLNYNPHLVLLGYNCLKTRELDMIIMRALGLPFEHNRACRDVYIDVWIENIEPSYIQLFTKDNILPKELQNIPYDYFSIMHFGERDYSKNGHRTIRFKIPSLFEARDGQTKIGLTPSDIKKIALIYGPECRTRDRAEKIAICRTYPRVSRRKREIIEPPANMSRVKPNSANVKMKTEGESSYNYFEAKQKEEGSNQYSHHT